MEFGNSVGTQNDAGLPNITGSFYTEIYTYSASGAFERSFGGTPKKAVQTTNISSYDGFTFDASLSSSIYGNSSTVQPQSLVITAIIKY